MRISQSQMVATLDLLHLACSQHFRHTGLDIKAGLIKHTLGKYTTPSLAYYTALVADDRILLSQPNQGALQCQCSTFLGPHTVTLCQKTSKCNKHSLEKTSQPILPCENISLSPHHVLSLPLLFSQSAFHSNLSMFIMLQDCCN